MNSESRTGTLVGGGVTRTDTALPGVFHLALPGFRDERGWFAPIWVRADLLALGLDADVAQISLASNPTAGTLRGLHFQRSPHSEVKIVQVVSGAICDVVVDLRRTSPTFKRSIAVRLDADAREALYLPKGVAHGYQTLVPDTTVLYTVSAAYAPEYQAGLAWDDPALAIPWPMTPTLVSDRDRALPVLREIGEFPSDR